MSAARFQDFMRDSSASYASEKVVAGQWAEATALALAQAEFARLLPQGLATPDHFLFDIVAPAEGRTVGHLWVAVEERGGTRAAYVYDLAVHHEHRRQGHAKRAFTELDAWARAQGLYRIDLHVFGHNPGAQALYAALGYRVTSVTMAKTL